MDTLSEELSDLIARGKAQYTGGDYCLQVILSALRGPDLIRERTKELKRLTTARVRAIVCPHYDGQVNNAPLTRGEIVRRNELLYSDSAHFLDHYREATAAIIQLYSYDLWEEKCV